MIEKLEGKKHWDERRLENDWIGFIMKTYYFQMASFGFLYLIFYLITELLIVSIRVLYDKYQIFLKFYYIITKMIMRIKKSVRY